MAPHLSSCVCRFSVASPQVGNNATGSDAGRRNTHGLVGIPSKFPLLSGNVVLKRRDGNGPTSFVEAPSGQHEIELDSRVFAGPSFHCGQNAPPAASQASAAGVAGGTQGML
jgi:hypothetical protein